MIVKFETAKLAKEKGFPQKIGGPCYQIKIKWWEFHMIKERSKSRVSCPTQSELQTWLRNNHNIDAWAAPYIGEDTKGYSGLLYKNKQEVQTNTKIEGESFEETQENILFEALKHI